MTDRTEPSSAACSSAGYSSLGASPADPSAEPVTYRAALTRALDDAMAADAGVVVIGEDVAGGAGAAAQGGTGGAFGVTAGLYDRFGAERVIDTPIAESAMLSMAAGAAATGLRPVVDLMFADFAHVAADPLVNHIAQAGALFGDAPGQAGHLPLVIRAAFGAGDRSGAQHSQPLHGALLRLPAIRLALPATPADAYALLTHAIACAEPVVVLEHKRLYDTTGPLAGDALPWGRARVVRAGRDATLLAVAGQVAPALDAAERLSGHGIEVEVVDPRTLNPLDLGTLTASLARTGRLAITDEDRCAAEIVAGRLAETAFALLQAPPCLICPAPGPVPFAPGLEDAWAPDAPRIAEALRRLCTDG